MAALRGGRINTQRVATDAFGNALGESLASGALNGSQQEEAQVQAERDKLRDIFRRQEITDMNAAAEAENTARVQAFLDMNPIADASTVTMGRRMSFDLVGRTKYIAEEGTRPTIDEMLAKAQANLNALKAERDSALTDTLNRNSTIRETVTPIFEPITIEVPPLVSDVVGGLGDLAKSGIAGLADITVAPLADVAQTIPKALHTVVTGRPQDLTPLSSYGNSVVNGNAGMWEGLKATGKNVFNVSPAGMVYHSYTGGRDFTTAAMNGDVRGATREAAGLGLNFAGAKGAGLDRYGLTVNDIGARGPGRYQRGAAGLTVGELRGRGVSFEDALILQGDASRARIVQQIGEAAQPTLEAIRKLDPNARVGFRGSLASGLKNDTKLGPNGERVPFDGLVSTKNGKTYNGPQGYDADYFIVSDKLADQLGNKRFMDAADLPGNPLGSDLRGFNKALRSDPSLSGMKPGKPQFRVFSEEDMAGKISPDDPQYYFIP